MRFVLCLLPLLATTAYAQASSGWAAVHGTVRDSITNAPLAGATVQITSDDPLARFGRAALADSLGRYRLDSIPGGRYLLGFMHPVLDSLGVAPTVRAIVVTTGQLLRADLGVPAPARLRAAICATNAATDSGAVIVGTVRDASDGSAVNGASVRAEWTELTFSTQGIQRRTPSLVATTGENGYFAICSVPAGGTVMLAGGRGADSTDLLEVLVPAGGFVRRELYLGRATTSTAAPVAANDSLARAPRAVRRGTGRLAGRVVAAVGDRPLGGAQVGVVDGPQVRTGADGLWSLNEIPVGTRTLEVRAVGYYPYRGAVNVVEGAPPVHVALSTLRAVLDTVRVTASAYSRTRERFNERRRASQGLFLGSAEIMRRQPLMLSDVFRNVSGLRIELDSTGMHRRIVMRGAFGSCAPVIVVDGHPMNDLTTDDLDSWSRPEKVVGVEIYTEGTVPLEFQTPMGGCGSIVIWTR